MVRADTVIIDYRDSSMRPLIYIQHPVYDTTLSHAKKQHTSDEHAVAEQKAGD